MASPRLNEPPAKARKVGDLQNSFAVPADVAIEEPKPPIFNLINDCCYAILDWLPLTDLRSFALTCKWAQQVAANFYRMNYLGMYCAVNSIGHISGPAIFDLEHTQKLRIWGTNLDPYRHVKSYCNEPIKQIHLEQTTISAAMVNCLKKVLRTVERVTVADCTIDGDFYENFLKFCTNLRVLSVRYSCLRNSVWDYILIGANNRWLTQKYPMLECLEVIDQNTQIVREIDELKIFFEQNPNVRSFTTNSVFLEENWDMFRTTNIKLHTLAIKLDGVSVASFRDNLNSLHERGVFQRFHWYTYVSGKVSPLNALEKLVVTSWSADMYFNISTPLVNIKELSISNFYKGSNMEASVRNLVNLERIYFGYPTSGTIVLFIRHAPKLKKIKVGHCFHLCKNPKGALHLLTWNKEREKLVEARKVTIYVEEDVYLATKWATNKTDHNLIELKRGSSYNWDEDFKTK